MQRKANNAKTATKTSAKPQVCRCYWCASKARPLYPNKPNAHLMPRGFHGHY